MIPKKHRQKKIIATILLLFIMLSILIYYLLMTQSYDSYRLIPTAAPSSATATATMVGYYSKLQSNETSNISDASAYDIYNIYLSYTNLNFSGSVVSFTSYFSYPTFSSTSDITFFTGTPISGTINAKLNPSIPFLGQSGVFCLPLMTVPTGTALADIFAGIQLTTTSSPISSTPITLSLAQMSPLIKTIYETTGLPIATIGGNCSSISIATGSLPLATIKKNILTAMEAGPSLYPGSITTTNASQLTIGTNIYTVASGVRGSSPAVPGQWFLSSQGGGTLGYSGTGLSLITKSQNYSVPGLNMSSTPSSNNVSVTMSTSITPIVSITTNGIPTHPYGTFPDSGGTSSVAKFAAVAAYCATNNNSIAPTTSFSINNVVARPSTSQLSALTASSIGYIFDNTLLFAASDETGNNPLALELGDIFLAHCSQGNLYHRHFIAPALYNWIIDNQLRVIGFLADGYPIVAPFLVNSSTGVRVVQSSDLNINHGLVCPITFTLPGATASVSFDFFYVATLDFPYTIAAFYGST